MSEKVDKAENTEKVIVIIENCQINEVLVVYEKCDEKRERQVRKESKKKPR